MKALVILAALNGFVAVAAGAFGAHALRERLSGRQLEVYETAARYQLPHAVATLVAALLAARSRAALAAGYAFVIGSVLFAGSLYGLALTEVRWLGMVTPFGGVGLLVGWVLLAVGACGMREPLRNAP